MGPVVLHCAIHDTVMFVHKGVEIPLKENSGTDCHDSMNLAMTCRDDSGKGVWDNR